MKSLLSKVQYRNFERGEFVAGEERDYDGVVALIESFPWEEQRKGIVMDLTGPGVVIQGEHGDFLRLGVYYNGKFVLQYANWNDDLYSKSFVHLEEAYPYIREFFTSPVFDHQGFRKEPTPFKKVRPHFRSQDFRYEITPERVRAFLLSTSGLNLLVGIMILAVFIARGYSEIGLFPTLVLIGMMFIMGGGLNLYLFFNHYRYARNLVLIMSKGNDVIYFGDPANLVEYDKRAVVSLTVYKVTNTKHTIGQFSVQYIQFNDGRAIEIPNLLIPEHALAHKLEGFSKLEVNRFPWM